MSKLSEKPLDVHLMIEDPDRYIQEFRDAGATIITVHYEACKHLHRTIQLIKSTGARAGVALNPHTPTSVLQSIIADVDLVLIMSVNPGFGGQKFIPNAIEKVAEVKAMIKSSSSNSLIEIDGGVGLHNAQEIKDAGCDILVAGNAVFSSENPNNTISQLKA
jgi:ribulose-phosphate 3-epimerase